MKKILFYMTLLLVSANVWSQTIDNAKTGGWLETAFVQWAPVAGADSYNVYYTGGGQTNVKIDTQLIRSYGTYFRADVLGLAAGTYTLTIKPVTASVEGTGTTTSSLTVMSHDRNGFAFSGGKVPGGYKMDGTPKSGAIILYITQNTKNTISFDVITGSNGTTKTNYVGLQNILYGIKKGYDTRPYIFRLIGNITDMTVMEGGDITIENNNNTNCYLTLEGVGSDAVVNGMGVRLKSASNIEINNLGLMNCNSTAGDNIGMQQDNDHVWVHNNDLFYGDAGSDADQIKGDGAMDNKNSTYITMSYNHFWDSGKCSLLGLSEGTTVGLYITYHHNWFDHSDSRHPRVRYYSAHIYNNYFDGNSKYGSGSTLGSSLFVEGNYYRDTKHPMMISLQGTDIAGGLANATFSGEDGGIIKSFNNTFDKYDGTGAAGYNDMAFVPYSTNNIQFDAYDAATRSTQVPSSVVSVAGGNTHNNFDTDPALYVATLVPDSPAVAKTKTMQYSGRVKGGDLKWTFDNTVDDASSLVITALKTALTNYATTMVFVQGESISAGSQTLVATTSNNIQSVVSGNAIDPIVFTWGADATDASVANLPAGLSSAKNSTAKTITISGTPTATGNFTVTTSGTAGTPAALLGQISFFTSTQTLTCTTTNNNQTVTNGSAIVDIVYTWGGDATDASATGLPLGVATIKNTSTKTLTITGTPSATGSYSVTSTGPTSSPITLTGTITVNTPSTGNEIHNFTTDGVTSTFYTISGNMNSTAGSATYDGLTLTARLKMESATSITYITTSASTLTLVFDPTFTGTVKVDAVNYTAVAGVVSVSVAAGSHTIAKGTTTNLFYIKTEYALGLGENTSTPKLTLYPNPVTSQLYLSDTNEKMENVAIYSLNGALVKTISNVTESIDVSNLSNGSYLVKVTTENGSFTQKIIKK